MMQAMLFRGRAAENLVEAWVRDHYDEVWNFCRRRVGVTAAGDAAQETFLIAQRKGGGLGAGENARPFLYGIALRVCMASLRKSRRELTFEWIEEPATNEAEGIAIDRVDLRAAMARLSPDHKEVVVLHEIEGLTYEEIGRVLSVPVGTVKSRLHHAFQHLRRTLMDRNEANR